MQFGLQIVIVAYTIRIKAFNNILNNLWNNHRELFNDFVIFNNVNGCIRRNERNLIYFFLINNLPANLYYSFLPKNLLSKFIPTSTTCSSF